MALTPECTPIFLYPCTLIDFADILLPIFSFPLSPVEGELHKGQDFISFLPHHIPNAQNSPWHIVGAKSACVEGRNAKSVRRYTSPLTCLVNCCHF